MKRTGQGGQADGAAQPWRCISKVSGCLCGCKCNSRAVLRSAQWLYWAPKDATELGKLSKHCFSRSPSWPFLSAVASDSPRRVSHLRSKEPWGEAFPGPDFSSPTRAISSLGSGSCFHVNQKCRYHPAVSSVLIFTFLLKLLYNHVFSTPTLQDLEIFHFHTPRGMF